MKFVNILLRELNDLLIHHGKTIKDFNLPILTLGTFRNTLTPIIIEE